MLANPIPQKDKTQDGAMVLSGAIGMPKNSQKLRKLLKEPDSQQKLVKLKRNHLVNE